MSGKNRTPASERRDEICPVCQGDGGARGECYKCGGSGWVTHSAHDDYLHQNLTGKTPPARTKPLPLSVLLSLGSRRKFPKGGA